MSTKMKLLVGLCVTSAFLGNVALADNHTVSIGYAQSKLQDSNYMRGVNLQYRYEWDSPVSALASFSYVSHKENAKDFRSAETKDSTYTFLVGPAYRINQYVSLYGALGFSHFKTRDNYKFYNIITKDKSTRFAYGAGVIVNPTENISVNLGYEGSRANAYDYNYAINGFTIGVGYRF